MKRHCEYKIVQSKDVERFTEIISDSMADGFKLSGGVSTSISGDYCFYFQALYKDYIKN